MTKDWYIVDYSVRQDDRYDKRSNLFLYSDDTDVALTSLTILECGDFTDIPSMFACQDEVFVHLMKLKNFANALYISGNNYVRSLDLYCTGIRIIESPAAAATLFVRRTVRDVQEIIVPIYLNTSLVNLKLGRWTEAIDACTRVLDQFDPRNVKALFRRAQGRYENRDFSGSRNDLVKVLEIDSNNVAAKELLKRLMMTRDEEKGPMVEMKLSFGCDDLGRKSSSLKFQLDKKQFPRTVENFLSLLPKYRGCKVFKAVKDQFFQTGDYEFNDGSGGNCGIAPDRVISGRKFFEDELRGERKEIGTNKGRLGMANYGPNTNGSQFYVTLGDMEESRTGGSIFGKLVSGWDVLDEINSNAKLPHETWTPDIEMRISSIDLVSE